MAFSRLNRNAAPQPAVSYPDTGAWLVRRRGPSGRMSWRGMDYAGGRTEGGRMSTLDPEAAQLLRRAIQLGDPGRTSPADPRRPVDHPVPFQLPPARRRRAAPRARALRRAAGLASARGTALGRRPAPLAAPPEAAAVAPGLSLARLRFARFWLRRAHPDGPPGRRVVSPRT